MESFLTKPINSLACKGLLIMGLIGGIFGALLASFANPFPVLPPRVVPMSYRFPKMRGGTALRLAMVHDILHERYLKHGTTWYEARNLAAQNIVAHAKTEAGTTNVELWNALDDLAVGLERLDKHDEAAETMRRKLTLLPALGAAGTQHAIKTPTTSHEEMVKLNILPTLTDVEEHYYTAHANLGTALIHGNMGPATKGDSASVARVKEGLAHIETAIAINPAAHFGRERWQAIAVQHLLVSMEMPQFWTRYCLCGLPLDNDPVRDSRVLLMSSRFIRYATSLDNPSIATRVILRREIYPIVFNKEWANVVHPAYLDAVPFDEPTLAFIGMWTLGGGPNPLSALTLGRIMEYIGQNTIAFNAYERAMEMKERMGPTPEISRDLAEYCVARQAAIAQFEAPADAERWANEMRAVHRKELAFGEGYQRAYQEYEAKRIAAGTALEDPHFYDDFFKGRPEIASDPGLSDDNLVVQVQAAQFPDFVPCTLLGAGLAMVAGIGRSKWERMRRQAKLNTQNINSGPSS